MHDVKPKILYVDDEPINLELFELIFEDNFEIITAESGKSGLEMLKDHVDVKIILSDMRMPEMDGLEFIKKVKSKTKNIPCFMLSAFDMSSEINNAIKTGLISGYHMKPFDGDLLYKQLAEHV